MVTVPQEPRTSEIGFRGVMLILSELQSLQFLPARRIIAGLLTTTLRACQLLHALPDPDLVFTQNDGIRGAQLDFRLRPHTKSMFSCWPM